MNNTKTMQTPPAARATRLLTISIMAAATFLMLGLAYTASAATLERQLDVGMSGSDVSTLQTFLAQDTSIYPQGLVTGYFGPLTSAAVAKFQTRNNIDSVGRVGPITLAALNTQMNGNTIVTGDTTAPAISALTVNTTNTTSTLNWNTNEGASAIIYYSLSPLSVTEAGLNGAITVGGSSLVANTDLRMSHTGAITGLQPNSTYYYIVYVKDGSGNENVTWPSTFKTSQ